MITIRVPAGPTRPVRFSAMAESESPVVADSDAAVTVTSLATSRPYRDGWPAGKSPSHQVPRPSGGPARRVMTTIGTPRRRGLWCRPGTVPGETRREPPAPPSFPCSAQPYRTIGPLFLPPCGTVPGETP